MLRNEHGHSLVELLIVVTILGIAAAVAIPDISTTHVSTLDLAAEKIAEAVRYARSEAQRTGNVHGVEINQGTQRIVVYKANLATTPVSIASILYHPVSRQSFDFNLDSSTLTNGVRIINADDPFLYASGRNTNLLFNATGVPIWIDNASASTYSLEDGAVELTYGRHNRTVRVAQITGRVTVQ
ncbi:MAG: GspH/FimT family pseudopilin [Gammaproteobacteria bacterium]